MHRFHIILSRVMDRDVNVASKYQKLIIENLDSNNQNRHDARYHLCNNDTESADFIQGILELIRIFSFFYNNVHL